MSPPAEKARPSALITTTATAGSSRQASSAAVERLDHAVGQRVERCRPGQRDDACQADPLEPDLVAATKIHAPQSLQRSRRCALLECAKQRARLRRIGALPGAPLSGKRTAC